MGNKRNHIQNHRGRFQEEFQRTRRSEMLDWRSKQRGRWSETSCFLHKSKIERQREGVFCRRERVPCNSMVHTEAQQIYLRKNFYGRNRSLRTAISQDRKDTERKSYALESDDAELQLLPHQVHKRGVECDGRLLKPSCTINAHQSRNKI